MTKILKENNFCQVYFDPRDPGHIVKQYRSGFMGYNIEELCELRKKLLAIKEVKGLPDFQIRPIEVSELYKPSDEVLTRKSFYAVLPLVNGISLDKYLKIKGWELELETIGFFILDLEKKVMSAPEFVFPDLAKGDNIFITSKLDSGILEYKVIDPDDIQFSTFSSEHYAPNVVPQDANFIYQRVMGLKKCYNIDSQGRIVFNKSFDCRSMYALFYYIINREVPFYNSVNDTSDDYEKRLLGLGVPTNSTLFEKTMKTVSDSAINESIGESVLELAEDGYHLKLLPTGQRKLYKQ